MKQESRRRIFVVSGILLSYVLTAAYPILAKAQSIFASPVEIYTNAIGILRVTTVYPPDSESRELVGGGVAGEETLKRELASLGMAVYRRLIGNISQAKRMCLDNLLRPNEVAPVDAPITLRFQFRHPCRRVTEQRR